MAYVTNSDVELRLGTTAYVQLTDDGGAGVADETKVDAARLAAESEVDSYLGTRYRVPIDLSVYPEVASLLKSVVLDLVEYRLRSRFLPVPGDVVSKRDRALRWLGQVSRGEAVLPASRVVDRNPAVGIGSVSKQSPRMMSRESLDDL